MATFQLKRLKSHLKHIEPLDEVSGDEGTLNYWTITIYWTY